MKNRENNRISQRQLYRQMILSVLAPFLLCIPGAGGIQGVSGAAGIGIAVVILLVYIFFLIRSSHGYTDPVRILGKVKGRLLGLFFVSYLIMTNVYILNLIKEVVPVWAVSGISVKWLLLWAVIICAYGTDRGMQKRGRMAGVSGGIFLAVIVIMLFLCVGQGKMEYLKEMLEESSLQSKKIVDSAYGFLCAFSGISLLPFVLTDVEHRGSAGKTVMAAVFTVSSVLLIVLFCIPAVLGWRRIQSETYPILPLMAGANLPGNILARFDVLWLAFLLYGIFFAIGSCFHYGNKILEITHLGNGKYWLPAAAYVFSLVQIHGKSMADFYSLYLKYIFVPGLVLIQTGFLFRGQNRKKKTVISAAGLSVILMLVCTGCAGIEPEKRMYPLAMGIDTDGSEYIITYGMPDLPRATGGGKAEEGDTSVLTIHGNSFDSIEKSYERTQEKYLDIGHLQILVIGRHLTETDKWKEFMEYLKEEPLAGENIYVFQAENPEELLKWSDGGTSFGEYVTGLIENRMEKDRKKGVTLRQVYYQWYQRGVLQKLPEITMYDDEIQVWIE